MLIASLLFLGLFAQGQLLEELVLLLLLGLLLVQVLHQGGLGQALLLHSAKVEADIALAVGLHLTANRV
jgi:hypothetical protein